MTSENASNEDYIFSSKRIFVNNIDSYHGKYFLKELEKFLKLTDDATPSHHSSQTVQDEEVEGIIDLPAPQPYEIIGTVTDPKTSLIDNVKTIISKDDFGQILSSGFVVFDITSDFTEVKTAKTILQLLKELLIKQSDELSGWVEKRHFVLVSTVMTWALTKPLDPDVPDMPFVEMDFRKRRPHPNYKDHCDLEKEILALSRKYKPNFRGVVLNAGITYGGREDVLEYWFQKAWENEPVLPILGRGSNAVPLINTKDLATIIFNLLANFPDKLYILAVEQNVTKQKEIIKSIGRTVGTGMFKCIQKEDAFLIPELTQRVYDSMTLNISMEPTFLVETMDLQWTSEGTFAENVPTLINQYKKERTLKPFKVVLYGPPGVGKTTLAKRICETYGLLYISPYTVHMDIAEDLAWRVARMDAGDGAAALELGAEDEAASDADEEDAAGGEEIRQNLALLRTDRPLTDQDILGYVRQRMSCHEALNKGWVLDGYPSTVELCAALYGKGSDIEGDDDAESENDEKFDEDANLYDNIAKKLLPDIVISLEATDDFVCDKIMSQPEDIIRGTRFEEETLVRRLSEFRAANTRDATSLNFYDELDIHPLVVPVVDHDDYDMNQPYAGVTLRMGKPCRYGKLIAAIEEAERKEKREMETLKQKELKAQKELEERMLQDRQDRMEYWSEMYGLIREEEEAALAAAAEPLRTYLVTHVLPTLTPALLHLATTRPDDPLDYLAEYLFKLNPSGRMLEPGYNLQGELLLDRIQLLDASLQDLDVKIESSSHFRRDSGDE